MYKSDQTHSSAQVLVLLRAKRWCPCGEVSASQRKTRNSWGDVGGTFTAHPVPVPGKIDGKTDHRNDHTRAGAVFPFLPSEKYFVVVTPAGRGLAQLAGSAHS